LLSPTLSSNPDGIGTSIGEGDKSRFGGDPDDAWLTQIPNSVESAECKIGEHYNVRFVPPARIAVNQPVELQFTVRSADSRPVVLEPYLGMRGHLVISRDDGAV